MPCRQARRRAVYFCAGVDSRTTKWDGISTVTALAPAGRRPLMRSSSSYAALAPTSTVARATALMPGFAIWSQFQSSKVQKPKS